MKFIKAGLLFLIFCIFGSNMTFAAQNCANPFYFSTLSDVPFIFKPQMYSWRYGNDHHRDAYDNGHAADWIMITGRSGLESLVHADTYTRCDYNTAIAAYNALIDDKKIQQDDLKTWVSNQDKIMAACEGQTGLSLDNPPALPPRLAQEKEYQDLALSYHTKAQGGDTPKNIQSLIDGFKKIAFATGHPRQVDALRTYIKLTYNLHGLDAAWDESEKIRTSPATKALWPRMEDIRFELMTLQRGEDNENESLTAQKKIIPWLMSVIRQEDMPDNADKDYKLKRRADAFYNIHWYLPSYYQKNRESPIVLDWWMNNEPVNSIMLQAARDQMNQDDLLSLFQLSNTIQFQNLTRLYDLDNPIRTQQKKLSTYAFEKFEACRGPEWLPYALSFAVKGQDNLDAILKSGHEALDNKFLIQTQPDFRLALWKELVKAELLANHNDAAIHLLQRTDIRDLSDYSSYFDDMSGIFNEALEWFIHQGDYEWGRKALTAGAYLKYGYNKHTGKIYRLILADTPEMFSSVVADLDDGWSDDLLAPMFNLLPAKELLKISGAAKDNYALALARTALTRAWLLKDKTLTRNAAMAVEKLDESGDKSALKALEGDDLDQTLFFLSHPRMRMTNIGFEAGNSWSAMDIDQYNHSDNNWWCAYKPDQERKNLEREWSLMPGSFWDGEYHSPSPGPIVDPTLFEAKRAGAIARHPFLKLIDEHELTALSKIPSGPQFLSARAIAEAGGNMPWLKKLWPDKRIPQSLYLSVRSTRYGCERDGPHGAYSRKAFDILHRYYKNSSWAEATPYWFN